MVKRQQQNGFLFAHPDAMEFDQCVVGKQLAMVFETEFSITNVDINVEILSEATESYLLKINETFY